ncbi:MAG: hypothetical protein ABI175_03985, partial [Polyangiales bacterium]
MTDAWQRIEDEAHGAFVGAGRFPLRAYSELMPPPYVGLKPYAPHAARGQTTDPVGKGDWFDIDEYEHAQLLEPGLDRIADTIASRLERLLRGKPHGLSHTLIDNNPSWPLELADAARDGLLGHDPLVVICPLALSRTQDDKGNDRWSLFGTSHDGAAPFFDGVDEQAIDSLLKWAEISGPWRIHADAATLPAALHGRLLGDAPIASLTALVTFTPFSELPAEVREAYLGGTLVLVPSPAALVLFEHPRYRELARELNRARQIPLLHLFPRVEDSFMIRIPQSGWLDEQEEGGHGHKV